MSIDLPRPPDAAVFESDPKRYVRDLTSFFNRLVAELERDSRDVTTPAKAVFAVTNIAAPTTTLDGAAATLTDVKNFLGGLYATLLAKGVIRTKAGAA